MKLQHLTIIFIIIIIPILLVVSYYIGLQIDTINKQTEYDTKLQEATAEALSAFEINTVEWNPKFSELQDSKRRDVEASINTFVSSVANKMGVPGTAKEYTLNYIPAIVYTLYDGYYMYLNADSPVIDTDPHNGQAVLGSNGEPIYNYDERGIETTEYKHSLQSFTPYSETLTSGDDVVTINYTFDNYVRVYGTLGGEAIDHEGYLTPIEKIKIENAGTPNFTVSYIGDLDHPKDTTYDLTNGEVLEEKICYTLNDGESYEYKTFAYVYDTENTKYYFDEVPNSSQTGQIGGEEHFLEFFYLDSYNRVNWVKDLSFKKYKKIIEPVVNPTTGVVENKEFYMSLTGILRRTRLCL